MHLCSACGFYCAHSGPVNRHAKLARFEASHKDFKVSDVVCIKTVEQYYNFIQDIDYDKLHKRAWRFLNGLNAMNYKNEDISKEEIPQQTKNSIAWSDLQARIDSKRMLDQSKKLYFCSVCGFQAAQKNNVDAHARSNGTFTNKEIF